MALRQEQMSSILTCVRVCTYIRFGSNLANFSLSPYSHLRLSGKTEDEEAALGKRRKVELFPCSLIKGTGYGAGLKWMARYF